MTDKEKLQKALEALKSISQGGFRCVAEVESIAAKVYAELTAPRFETVKGWVNVYDRHGYVSALYETKESADRGSDSTRIDCIEITYSRPIEGKEEVLTLIVKGNYSNNRGVVFLPKEWCGEEVEIRRLKGE